ncbi:aldo/keto reductase [Mesorhizobium sp. BR1-1-16]|uniref:aldo/keto reductase n=1 Tax=Mesorhizobium sp. BR1-1-16 TaxID=2876653 RepID=UPI001CCFB32C|nr:aldo/keto reductase [Mesorhizobium sp. BR1-1-16]MBZ9938136.1 aldo/keto reductase [Mesorhizobium sp. BR1-1-16]
MTAMERRQIGGTALSVSVLGLGAAPLGGLYQPSSAEQAIETVQAAAAAGIDLFDVAPHYGQGLAEQRLGVGLATLRDKDFTLSTKVGRLLDAAPAAPSQPNWPEALPFSTLYDASRAGILRSVEDSRHRLGELAPAMLFLHDPDRQASGAALAEMIAEAYRTLADLRAEGLVSAIGIGVNAAEPCRMALDTGDWDCFLLAGTYSVLRQDDDGLLDLCERRGVSVLIGGPYMSGALAGGATWRYRPIPPDIAADIARLRAVCARNGVPVEAAALQFPLRHPAVAAVLVGMRSADEVERNVAFLQRDIPHSLWADLAAEGLITDAVRPPIEASS